MLAADWLVASGLPFDSYVCRPQLRASLGSLLARSSVAIMTPYPLGWTLKQSYHNSYNVRVYLSRIPALHLSEGGWLSGGQEGNTMESRFNWRSPNQPAGAGDLPEDRLTRHVALCDVTPFTGCLLSTVGVRRFWWIDTCSINTGSDVLYYYRVKCAQLLQSESTLTL